MTAFHENATVAEALAQSQPVRACGDLGGRFATVAALRQTAGMKRLLPLLFGLACTLAQAAPASDAGALFSTAYRDVTGQPASLAKLRGKPLLVNFWARWCGPCREEIPELESFHRAHGGKITVIGIAIEDEAKDVRAFLQRYSVTYPSYLAGDAGIDLMRKLGNSRSVLPYTLYIDGSGNIVGEKVGRLRAADLQAALKKLGG